MRAGGWSSLALSDYVIGPRTGHMVWMIFAAVALLWILACANVRGIADGTKRRAQA